VLSFSYRFREQWGLEQAQMTVVT